MLAQDIMSFGNRIKRRFPAPLRAFFVFLLRPAGRVLEKKQLRHLYSELVQPGNLVFDVGAHSGTMTEALLEVGARVVAVEPLPDCVREMREKFADRPDVILEAVGVGDAEGEMRFSICDKPQGSTFDEASMRERDPGLRWSESLTVPVTTLDRLIQKHGKPRFCKIDVEGFEIRVLNGLTQSLPILCFEFHRQRLAQARECAERIQYLGPTEFQVSLYMQHRLHLTAWSTLESLFTFLDGHPDPGLCGDIYARTPDA